MISEKQLHKSICKYIKYQYKDAYFLSDPSGIKMSIGMSVELKATRSFHKQLDLVILEPRNNFHGLIIELKRDVNEVYKKNGDFRKSEHIEEQNKSISHLRKKGYFVAYGFGFEHTKKIIDNYLLT